MGVQYRGEPEFVIEGNPSGIRGRVASMKTCSESFDQVGESLGGVETEHWVGKAADRFRSRLEEEPRRWTGVADGFRSAAAALEGYAAALEAAQQAARVCKENYEEGKRVSATAKADYDRDVSEGFQKKAAWEAQNGPGTYTLTITPFTDPGQALRDRAVADFQAVIEDLEKTGGDTEQAVAQAHADADPTRQWPNKGTEASSSAADLTSQDAAEDEERGKLDPAVKEEWSRLSDEDRMKVLQAIVDEEFAKDGMKAPKISFKTDAEMTQESGPGTRGLWHEGAFFGLDSELSINKEKLDDSQILHTIAHEARHAEQHQLIKDTNGRIWDYAAGDERDKEMRRRESVLKNHNVTDEEVRAWEHNFKNYIPATENEQAYKDQPVERDARAAGRYFVNSLTPEDFENYKRKAGVK